MGKNRMPVVESNNRIANVDLYIAMVNVAEEISRETAADLVVSDPLSSWDLIRLKYTGIHFNSLLLPSASYILPQSRAALQRKNRKNRLAAVVHSPWTHSLYAF